LIAEAIEARVFKLIEAVANRADPVVTAYVQHRIARLQTAVSVDVSLGTETRVAPSPLTKSLALPPKTSIAVVDGKIADPERTRRDKEKHAINYWLQFVCGPRSRQADMAAIATLTWLVAKVRTRPLDRQST
jgi:hypothetical protein